MNAAQPHTPPVDERIARFLARHHVLTLATVADGAPYCSNAFYAYDAVRNRLIFAADAATRHAREMLAERRVAASKHGSWERYRVCSSAARRHAATRRIDDVICAVSPMPSH